MLKSMGKYIYMYCMDLGIWDFKEWILDLRLQEEKKKILFPFHLERATHDKNQMICNEVCVLSYTFLN